MVDRCGFSIENGKIICTIVQIDWDLGFDTFAKRKYIEYVQQELSYKRCSPTDKFVDVTTASNSSDGKSLSPYYLHDTEGRIIEDAWALTKELAPDVIHLPGAFDFIYLHGVMNGKLEPVILKYNLFIDVFHNPKKGFNTQARSCAVYVLLNSLGKLDLLNKPTEFFKWFKEELIIEVR